MPSCQYILTYICWLIVILLFIFIYKTPTGMRMRACGLNADAARTAGINVEKLRVLSLVLSGIFAALGGVYLSLNYLKIFSRGMVSGQGWMGVSANGIAAGPGQCDSVHCRLRHPDRRFNHQLLPRQAR